MPLNLTKTTTWGLVPLAVATVWTGHNSKLVNGVIHPQLQRNEDIVKW